MMKFVLTVFVGVMIAGHSLFAMCEEDRCERMTVCSIQEKIRGMELQSEIIFYMGDRPFKLFLHYKTDEFMTLNAENSSEIVCGSPSRTLRSSWDFLYFYDPENKTYTDGIRSDNKLKPILHMHIKQLQE